MFGSLCRHTWVQRKVICKIGEKINLQPSIVEKKKKERTTNEGKEIKTNQEQSRLDYLQKIILKNTQEVSRKLKSYVYLNKKSENQIKSLNTTKGTLNKQIANSHDHKF